MSATTQRSRALKRANEIRCRRAAERRSLRTLPSAEARARLGSLVMECPGWLAGLPVDVLLRWLPGVGEVKVARLLSLIDVRGVRSTGLLSVRQRQLLAVYLGLGETTTSASTDG